MKMSETITPEFLKKRNLITSDDILGKDVVDVKGHHIGMITQLHIDSKEKRIIGITIDTGFMRSEVFVGIDLIISFGVDAVYISHTPRSRFIGMMVFDRFGEYIGKVLDVELASDLESISRITVKHGLKKTVLPAAFAKVIARNIILKKTKEDILEFSKRQAANAKDARS